MAKSLRDQHLEEYFPAEVLKQLDTAEKNVLYDEFSNSELRLLGTQELDTIKTQTAKHLQEEFARRLSNIKADEYPMLKSWYLEISNSLHEIICSKCGALLGLEIDTKDDNMNPSHVEGKFVVAVGDKMYSYRPRIDGVMGYQCANIIDVTPEIREELESEYNTARDKRRKEIEKEVTERFSTGFKESSEEAYQTAIDNPELKKITSRKKAVDYYNFIAPGEAEIKTATDMILDNEMPPLDITDKAYCGNDTRWAQIEIDNIPEEHIMTSTTNDDIVKVKQDMNISGYEPDVKQTKTGYTVESFELREVKS